MIYIRALCFLWNITDVLPHSSEMDAFSKQVSFFSICYGSRLFHDSHPRLIHFLGLLVLLTLIMGLWTDFENLHSTCSIFFVLGVYLQEHSPDVENSASTPIATILDIVDTSAIQMISQFPIPQHRLSRVMLLRNPSLYARKYARRNTSTNADASTSHEKIIPSQDENKIPIITNESHSDDFEQQTGTLLCMLFSSGFHHTLAKKCLWYCMYSAGNGNGIGSSF